MKNSKDVPQVKRKMAIIFLCFLCISFQAVSQKIQEIIVEGVAEAVIGEGIGEYQKNKLVKFASKDGTIIAIIPASTRRLGFFQDGNIVVTKSNIYFGASDLSLGGTIIIPIAGIRHKKTKYESPLGIYKRDAVEVTYNDETRLFVFSEEEGEWEKLKKAIDKAVEMQRPKKSSWGAFRPGYYIVNASENRKVYFHSAPDASTKRNAYFTTQEQVYVKNTQSGFGYVEFVNTRGQASYGWIESQYLIVK